jgi:hypothetical protein
LRRTDLKIYLRLGDLRLGDLRLGDLRLGDLRLGDLYDLRNLDLDLRLGDFTLEFIIYLNKDNFIFFNQFVAHKRR